MKKIWVLCLMACIQGVLLEGQTPPPANMSSTTKFSATIEGPKHLEPSETKANQKQETPSSNYVPIQLPELTQKIATYLHPGILVSFNGLWEGSDHLFNLSQHIGVYVTIIKPEDVKMENTSEQLKKTVEAIFQKHQIDSQILVTSNAPPLPVFEIEVLIYPLDKGFVAFCSGRLFESVLLTRVKLESNMAFQAITWEKQSLIVGPKEGFSGQLTKEVSEIASAFAEKFTIFEKLKLQNTVPLTH